MPVLKVPFYTQVTNKYNPSGSCNVTCFAMALDYHGIKATKEKRLSDELYAELTRLGWSRHDPYDLQAIANTYAGIKSNFTEKGTFDDIIKSINEGNPVILHGYFTRFGHIIIIIGYDENGFIVHDPWGEWHHWGYDVGAHGKELHYSYNLIARKGSPESVDNPRNLFIHTVRKVK